MSLIPWRSKQSEAGPAEPTPLAALRTEIDRLFGAYVRDPLASVEWPFGAVADWVPSVDVAEDEKQILVRAEVPGIDPKDLEVTVSGSQLILAGEKKESNEYTGKDVHISESRSGSFRRIIPLPGNVDASQVEAQCANGVLTVQIRKAQAVEAKRVAVKVKEP